jgi:hypothetical protein
MSEVRTRIAQLAMVGLCLTWIGCGGGGAPDPSSDSAAAPDAAPPVADAGGGGAPAPEAPRGRGEQVARNEGEATAPADPVKAPDAPATPADDKAAAAPKGDSSGTTDLLNLGGGAAPAESPKDSPAPAASGGSGAPGFPGGSGGIGGPGGGQSRTMQAPGGGGDQSSRFPGGPGGRGGAAMAPPGAAGSSGAGDSAAGGPGGPGGGGRGFPGGPGMGGPGGGSGPGGPGGGNDAPPNFTNPMAGAISFMNAVKSKDRDRIAEATALRAPQEASKDSMKKLFTMILDGSVDDERIANLAKAFEGFQIIDHNEAKSSGKYGVILGKSNNKVGQLRRTITMRKEAKGWKVCDVSGL